MRNVLTKFLVLPVVLLLAVGASPNTGSSVPDYALVLVPGAGILPFKFSMTFEQAKALKIPGWTLLGWAKYEEWTSDGRYEREERLDFEHKDGSVSVYFRNGYMYLIEASSEVVWLGRKSVRDYTVGELISTLGEPLVSLAYNLHWPKHHLRIEFVGSYARSVRLYVWWWDEDLYGGRL